MRLGSLTMLLFPNWDTPFYLVNQPASGGEGSIPMGGSYSHSHARLADVDAPYAVYDGDFLDRPTRSRFGFQLMEHF